MLKGLIQRPVGTAMFFLALVVIGALGYARLPVDLLPSIRYPRLTVVTVYEDVPAEDLERLVTRPLEEVVTALAGVREVVSRTREGISTITVEYEWGTQMDFANLHLREAVDRVAFRDDFPEQAERPSILRWDPTSRPVSVLVLEGEGRRLESLTEFAREVLKPALEQVEGLSQAEVVGGADREIIVEPDPQRMAAYGVSVQQIQQALARSNISFPGGKVRQGPLRLSLRIDGEYRNLDEIRQTDILRRGDKAIRISDVATVFNGTKEAEGMTLLGDESVVSMLLYKEPESNTLQLSENVDTALAALSAEYPELAYSFVYRDAEYVEESFGGLRQSLLLGGILAILVLFVFLRDPISPLVVGLNIPVAIVTTFGLLYFSGVKLNLMSLGGLSLAAGMLVDNAIVVLENIHRHLRKQQDPNQSLSERGPGDPGEGRRLVAAAAESGAREMARPVLASTLTTIAVFFPVVYVPGIAGAFFRDQALTVTLSLAVSIVTALVGQAVLSAWLLRPGKEEPRGIFAVFARGFDRLHDYYHGLLVRALRVPALMIALLILFLAGSGFLLVNIERSFLPERSQGNLSLDLELPSGTPLEETGEAAAQLAAWADADPWVERVFSQVGRTQRTLAALQQDTSPHVARLLFVIKSGRGSWEEAQRVREELRQRLDSGLDGVSYSFKEEGIGLGEILGEDGGFKMGVLADEPVLALESAELIRDALMDVRGLSELQVDRVLGTPNVVVEVNREEALRSGVNPELIAAELRARVAGAEATTFNEIDQRIDISVRLARSERENLSVALDAPIEVAGGARLPLRSFLTSREERPVRELMRHNQRRMVMIRGEVIDRSRDDVWKEAEAAAAGLGLPGGVRWIEAGEGQEMRRSFRDLGLAMILAILLVYMILAAQFESFLDPLLIAAVIPIGLAGSALAIVITGGSLNILSLIGILALLGIAVNDAIVKIDTIRRLQEVEGLSGWDSIMETSRLRLRPILMTSVTTILAMVPMAIGLGGGEQMQRPLAITIIGGLSLTTVLTLFYTPMLYMLAHRIRHGGGEES